jgi:hypothetical protein
MMKAHLFGYLALSFLAACSGAATSDPGSADQDATQKKHGDHGAPSDTFPAFAVDVPQIKNNGGKVLTSPSIVTITWSSDTNAGAYEQFGDKLGDTAYWRDATSEYGVGAATSGDANHVRITDAPPAKMTDDDLEQLIANNVKEATTSGWPAWDDQKLYILYVPAGVKVTSKDTGKDACDDSEGYHTEVQAGSKMVVYAIVNENCKDDGQAVVDYATAVAAHELGEASTNPHTNTGEAWDGFDDLHAGYELFQQHQSEDGDACEFFDDSTYRQTEGDFSFTVQRMWSNASAAAGHNPCVPLDGKAYFNVAPLDLGTVQALQPDRKNKTVAGVAVLPGKSHDIALGFFSDDKTDAWTIEAVEGDGMTTPKSKHLDVSLDRTTGQNGEKAYLTVHAKSAGPKRGTLVTVISTLGQTKHYQPILIQTN